MPLARKLPHVFAAFVILTFAGCTPEQAKHPEPFVTEYGLGPDKWATAWLLSRRIEPQAGLLIVEPGQPLPSGRLFDLPDSSIRRQGNRSGFEVALESYSLDDPALQKLADIVHDIEVNFWAHNNTAEAAVVEHGYRELQLRHRRDAVAPDCYLTFFDSVHRALRNNLQTGVSLAFEDLHIDCSSPLSPASASLIAEVSISHLLTEMYRGKRVEFVDVREPGEFEEGHIPGAHNITLRDLDSEAIQRLKGADYVVSYCVKDFRGFEMAKAIKQAGIQQSVILKPYGIKGWVSSGLPTAGSKALSNKEAQAQLSTHIASMASRAL
ncbi:chromate resistance protein ChrB domain-containing protein [Microbulbifer sp. TYP-18]|uniref:chromate resistance protein ChrB domain-containing protein n=1 Tax=Microbulbifer sp. TYP-18 TaxID=3230024 RepID=UPI0034C5C211